MTLLALSNRYVAYFTECPLMSEFKRFKEFRGFFNWTMSYRADSDVFAPYGMITSNESTHVRQPSGFRPRFPPSLPVVLVVMGV